MTPPRWTTALLRRLASPPEAEILVGDLEEAHQARVARRGPALAALLTSLEAADIAFMLVRRRLRLPRLSMSWLDVKLAVRMLVRYPVLTLIGLMMVIAGIVKIVTIRIWSVFFVDEEGAQR